ncbi:MAG: glycoside hydrolase domain-containing protein, partial [Pyrinomonadaceae bacterium]
MKAIRVLIFTLLFTVSIFALEPEEAGQIAGLQQITDSVGIVHTKTKLYRTIDGGVTWNALSLDGGTIAGVKFASTENGWAVVYDRPNGQLVLASTRDGGNTWETRSVATDVFGEDTYLDEASLRIAGKDITATFRIPTSSNFEGRAVFRTTDGGSTWTQLERSIEKRTGDEPQPIASRNWTVKTEGTCTDAKRGCFQETRLLTNRGLDITPFEIKQASTVARLNAERSASTEVLLLPPNGSVRTSLNRGFDKCTAGTIAQMQTWWNNSPLYDANIYISGRNRGCSQAQLNANWVNQVSAMGWGLIPTIVGYQSPCINSTTFNGARFSIDPAVAETQGRGEADIAVTDAANLGLT